MHVLYTAAVTSVGGRKGHVQSSDGAVDLHLDPPPALGGGGTGANPEQLFAAGYAACFAGAMDYIAHQQKIVPGEIAIASKVAIGPDDSGAFTLAVQLDVSVPNLSQDEAEKLVAEAHQVCPYSRATRGNIEVTLSAHGGVGS